MLLTKQFLDDIAVVFTIARLEECDAAIDKSDTKFCVGHDDVSFLGLLLWSGMWESNPHARGI